MGPTSAKLKVEQMKSLISRRSPILWVLGLILAGLIIGIAALFFTVQYFGKSIVVKYTDPLPRELPTVEVTRGEIKVLKNKWENFKQALKVGATSEKLELTSTELNVMLLTDPELNKFQGKVVLSIGHENIVNALLADDESLHYLKGTFYVTVKDGRIYADVSLPFDAIGLGDFGDRFVNASGELKTRLVGQKLEVRLDPKEINGEVLPGMVLNRVKELDLYELFVKNHPVYGRLGSRIKSIEVEDDQILLELTKGNGPLPVLPEDSRREPVLADKAVEKAKEIRNLKGLAASK
jgi:hypothetical protein